MWQFRVIDAYYGVSDGWGEGPIPSAFLTVCAPLWQIVPFWRPAVPTVCAPADISGLNGHTVSALSRPTCHCVLELTVPPPFPLKTRTQVLSSGIFPPS